MDANPRRSATKTVLGIIPPRPTGVTYARFFVPFGALREHGFALRTLPDRLTFRQAATGWDLPAELLDGVDVVMFPQCLVRLPAPDGRPLDLTEAILRHARERGLPTVYSVDDHLAGASASNPVHGRSTDIPGDVARLLDAADALIVTTPALNDVLAVDERPTFVLPNAVDAGQWRRRPEDRARAGKPPRLGWAGSSSHLEDLIAWLPAVERLRGRVNFELEVLGLVDAPLDRLATEVRQQRSHLDGPSQQRADLFLEVASRLRRLDAKHFPFGDVGQYVSRLPDRDWDIGACPLGSTEFDRCKSALKFYEYAAAGTLTVASDVEPYRDEVSLLASDTDGWVETLERYLTHPERRAAETEAQRHWVMEHRTIQALVPRWRDALNEIVNRSVDATRRLPVPSEPSATAGVPSP